jgi:hypothetical protein
MLRELTRGTVIVTTRWKCQRTADGTILAGNVVIERDGFDYSGKARICDAAAAALADDGQWNAGHLYGRLRLLLCVQCGDQYVGDHASTLCSDECKRKHQRQSLTPAQRLRMEQRKLARQGLKCAACGAPMQADRSSRKCCSDRCRQRWHRRVLDAV